MGLSVSRIESNQAIVHSELNKPLAVSAQYSLNETEKRETHKRLEEFRKSLLAENMLLS